METLSPPLSALGGLLLLFLAIYAMGVFTSKNHFRISGQTAIVTGGSQGMGLSISKLLASKGCHVVIVARDTTKLEKALTEISACATSPDQRFHQLSYDLRSPTSAPSIISDVTAWNNGEASDILFCCAGYAEPGFFASSSIEIHRSQMDTLYWSCAYMAHAVLNAWTQPTTKAASKASAPTSRHIVFTSSILAFIPMAGYAPYTPAKAAMRALADTLSQEVAVYNSAQPASPQIKIHTVFPMGILTPGYENEQKSKPALTKMLEESDKPQTPDEVAQIAIAGLEAGDSMITTQLLGHVLRGASLGTSVRNGVADIFWNMVGSIAMIFVVPDLLSKCSKWGKEKGMAQAC